MDELGRCNQQRWGALADARILYSRPWLDLDAKSAVERLDDGQGMLGDVAGLDVLCLAGGGGQQSAAFGLLGANVTVVDLTPTQLDHDQQAARHYGLTHVKTVQGDMRDLSGFAADSFDLVLGAAGTVIAGPLPRRESPLECMQLKAPGAFNGVDFQQLKVQEPVMVNVCN